MYSPALRHFAGLRGSVTARAVSKRNASRLVYSENGAPVDVVRLETFETPTKALSDKGVVVRMLMSPINPADLNTVQGAYAIRPDLPAVGGGEGVGVVDVVGRDVRDLRPGDWVLPSGNMQGTWTTHLQADEDQLVKIRNDIPLVAAATLRVNPSTAFRMLRDFVSLKPGDVVIQNGANSACGQAVIQLAKKMGVVSVNVVRKREDLDQLREELLALGADHVWTEEDLRKAAAFRDGKLARPSLALNCVGGDIATELTKCLAEGGIMVTYGGMSMKPVTVPTSALIFRDVSVRGFWYSRWVRQNEHSPQRAAMYEELAAMAASGELRPPRHKVVALKDYNHVLAEASKGFKEAKLIFKME